MNSRGWQNFSEHGGHAGAEEDVKAMLKKLSEQVLELLGSTMQHLPPGLKKLISPDVILMSTL